jgi:Flp pilus assembly protein TadG
VVVSAQCARLSRDVKSKCESPLRTFAQDTSGGITIFVMVVFLLLLVLGGMAVDYQRYELARADLQDALDRGVLAATNENQVYSQSSELTVTAQAQGLIGKYMASRNYRPAGMSLAANVTPVPGGRTIEARASEPVDTIFLRLVGIDRMTVTVGAGAIQAVPQLEIVLVLDVSKSMSWNSTSSPGTKLAQLKVAAKQFVETVLNADTVGRTLISIVPFSQQVGLPRSMADVYNLDRHHDYSSCFEYRSVDFGSVAMPTNPTVAYEQGQHFIETGAGSSPRRYGCPIASNAITPFSDDVDALKAAIDSLSPETFTATYFGVKWGAALLDTSARPVVDAMIADGDLPDDFADWPHDWSDVGVRKIEVVMSDGQNTQLYRIRDDAYNAHSPYYWNVTYPSYGEKYAEVDNNNGGEGDVVLKSICDQIKLKPGVTIYTIGFELSDQPEAAAALLDCASSLSTYYLVEGVEISTAFQNIADEIVNLKLIN